MSVKKSLTVRLQPELLEAAKSCAAREHRSLTNFIETSLLARIGKVGTQGVTTPKPVSQTSERPSRGE